MVKETQQRLPSQDEEVGESSLPVLKPKKKALETEKKDFKRTMHLFFDSQDFNQIQEYGRPRFSMEDILKSLCMMSYHGMSYRRAKSDIGEMKEQGFIKNSPSKSVLHKYANKEEVKKLLEQLIQISALFFREHENTIILDSTWFSKKMYGGGFRKVYDKKSTTLAKCRKLHISILKNSKIIAYAKTSIGTAHDSPFFEDLVKTVVKNGFQINCVLADAGYSAKRNYVICRELGIYEVYINFKSNSSTKRSKGELWRKQLHKHKYDKDSWNKEYRYRPLVEMVFSVLKRKSANYLRSKKICAQDVELLLKALVYNLTIMGRFN